jgi:uncharacterized protein (UPF0335 family)
VAEDLRSIFTEAKGGGFDATALRQIIRIRRREGQKIDRKKYEP